MQVEKCLQCEKVPVDYDKEDRCEACVLAGPWLGECPECKLLKPYEEINGCCIQCSKRCPICLRNVSHLVLDTHFGLCVGCAMTHTELWMKKLST